ncbi:AI-2E family transporter [Neiella marina]|uniref:AI-2E family transporter n=1 Tax=Neiella holothuriorum TaxID=2870530 RepID=A0ABS7EIL7_9GAMM|nr:AI-2E family transporter [Neiella holothuriorum]MBW8192197.1 AI-2E family transporter [Neiella holothuriorum]
MLQMMQRWYQRKFSDPAAVSLFTILLAGFLLIYFGGSLLAPILMAIALTYVLDWPVTQLELLGVRRGLASSLVLILFVGLLLIGVLGLIPLVWGQGVNLASELPIMFEKARNGLWEFQSNYPQFASKARIELVIDGMRDSVVSHGQAFLSTSLQSLVSLMTVLIYLFVVPLLVFFFLKDKKTLLAGLGKFLPANRSLVNQVGDEMNQQIVNYIRGKLIEILVVGIASYIFFVFMDLRYSALLAVVVGLSVLIPYVGATLVTIPVALVGLFQWGVTAEFGYLMLGYGIIQALDGNLLVPLLFSEAVNLHPAVIIIAVLVFGGLWGFWGVFFAIPLATLVKAVITAWPTSHHDDDGDAPQTV